MTTNQLKKLLDIELQKPREKILLDSERAQAIKSMITFEECEKAAFAITRSSEENNYLSEILEHILYQDRLTVLKMCTHLPHGVFKNQYPDSTDEQIHLVTKCLNSSSSFDSEYLCTIFSHLCAQETTVQSLYAAGDSYSIKDSNNPLSFHPDLYNKAFQPNPALQELMNCLQSKEKEKIERTLMAIGFKNSPIGYDARFKASEQFYNITSFFLIKQKTDLIMAGLKTIPKYNPYAHKPSYMKVEGIDPQLPSIYNYPQQLLANSTLRPTDAMFYYIFDFISNMLNLCLKNINYSKVIHTQIYNSNFASNNINHVFCVKLISELYSQCPAFHQPLLRSYLRTSHTALLLSAKGILEKKNSSDQNIYESINTSVKYSSKLTQSDSFAISGYLMWYFKTFNTLDFDTTSFCLTHPRAENDCISVLGHFFTTPELEKLLITNLTPPGSTSAKGAFKL